MSELTTVSISFKDMAPDEEVRERTEVRCRVLADEYPEPTHLEVTFAPDGEGFTAHAHATGTKEIVASAHAAALGLAADRLLDKLAKTLRRAHDKRLFARRRAAMQRNPKRRGR